MNLPKMIIWLGVVLPCCSLGWEASSLAIRSREVPDRLTLDDPDGLLGPENTQEISKYIARSQGMGLRLLVLDSIHPKYSQQNPERPVQAFLDELISLMGEVIWTLRPQATILVVFSNRECLVSFGLESNPNFPLGKLPKFREHLQAMSSPADLGAELRLLFGQAVHSMDPDTLGFLIAAGTGVIITLIVFSLACLCSSRKDEPVPTPAGRNSHLERRISMAERVEKTPQAMQVFIEHTCVICFSDLDNSLIPEHRPSHYPDLMVEKDDLDLTSTTLEEHLLGEDKIPIYAPPRPVDPRVLGESQGKESVFLSCRHNFHAGCLRQWLKRSKTCPICRAHFEAEKRNPENREEAVMRELAVGSLVEAIIEEVMFQVMAEGCVRLTGCCLAMIFEACNNN